MKQEINENCHFIPATLVSEAALHIDNVRREMASAGLKACLIAANPNIYYLSLRFFRGYVWVPAEGEAVYFIIRPNNLSGDRCVSIRKPEQILEWLTTHGMTIPEVIGLEYGELYYSEVERLKKIFSPATSADCTMVLKRARMVKTEWELNQMRIDGGKQAEVYRKVPELYHEGMTDLELQIAIEGQLRMRGNLGYPRVSGRLMQINMGSLLNGGNADVPTPYDFSMGGGGVDASLPVGADGKEMATGTTVMVDMNGAFNGYQTDMTRTWRIGEVEHLAEKAHKCSCRIMRRLEEIGKPGTAVADLYREAIAIAADEGLSKYFMGHRQQVAFIGHGVGIELNELPVIMERSRDTLAAGMTLAIEPKFVVPGVGAVGIENTYIVTAGGLENITPMADGLADLLE